MLQRLLFFNKWLFNTLVWLVFLLHYSYTLHDSQEEAHMFTASVEETLRKEERLLENAEMSLSAPIKVQRYVQEKRDCISQSQNKTTQIKT